MEVFIFEGRRHWYEGEGWTPVILPVCLLHAMGADTVLLTNASGGIREDLAPGTLMTITDHINMLGSNPLIGPHNPRLGPRFPDQTEVYNKALRSSLLTAGADTEGIYVAATGPCFETPAEIRAFKAMGADAVGMSTVPEAIVANALGLQTAALSCISNRAAGISPVPLSHEDIARTAEKTLPKMRSTLLKFLAACAHAPAPTP
jgi:purine-nucleoside phosphorylase